MGQAKRRGTREERVLQAVALQERERNQQVMLSTPRSMEEQQTSLVLLSLLTLAGGMPATRRSKTYNTKDVL